jgi:hypothetical protein
MTFYQPCKKFASLSTPNGFSAKIINFEFGFIELSMKQNVLKGGLMNQHLAKWKLVKWEIDEATQHRQSTISKPDQFCSNLTLRL